MWLHDGGMSGTVASQYEGFWFECGTGTVQLHSTKKCLLRVTGDWYQYLVGSWNVWIPTAKHYYD